MKIIYLFIHKFSSIKYTCYFILIYDIIIIKLKLYRSNVETPSVWLLKILFGHLVRSWINIDGTAGICIQEFMPYLLDFCLDIFLR